MSITDERSPTVPKLPSHNTLKVLLVAGTWPSMRCGIAPYSKSLAIHLASAGYAVQVVVDKAAAGEEDVRVIRIQDWSFLSVFRLVRSVVAKRSSIVHLQHPTRATRLRPAVYFLPLLVRLFQRRARVVTTFHYVRPVDWKTAIFRSFFLLPAMASHAVVVTTEWEAVYLRRIIPRKRVVICPAGPTFSPEIVSDRARSRLRAELGFGKANYVVAYFGYLLPNKGIETLIQALSRLTQTVKLLVVGGGYGSDDAYPGTLRDLGVELGLGDRIVWRSSLDDEEAALTLQAADCAALPYDEGASLKRSTLIMMLRLGLPTITTVGNELYKTMVDNRSLLLVKPRDPDVLAEAIDRLRTEPDVGSLLKSHAAEILDLVSWETIAAKHDELYRSLTA